MYDLIRESTVGELLNRLSGGRYLPYPDQRPDFEIPERYRAASEPASCSVSTFEKQRQPVLDSKQDSTTPAELELASCDKDILARDGQGWSSQALTRVPSRDHDPATLNEKTHPTHGPQLEITDTMATVTVDVEAAAEVLDKALEKSEIQAEYGEYILVDWYSVDDPENPKNWSFRKRSFVMFEICLLTFSIYIGSAIYTSSIPYIIEEFHVSSVVATLGLSLFVQGYAVGPLILSPLQELPSLGRNPVYIATLILFAIIQIPTALSTNIAGLMVLRFISGFLGSPALATGGASIEDIFPQRVVPYALGFWAMAATGGPVLGPIIGGFAAAAKGWRWPIWELAWISGFSSIFLAFFLPETLPDTILLKRARRLRKLTGNERLRSMSEIKQAQMEPAEVAKEYLVRPFQLMIEPAVMFINLYVGLAYAIFYLWFEAFPLVFTDIYHFEGGIAGLPFIGIVIGALLSFAFYALYLTFYLHPSFDRLHWRAPPEEYLRLAVIAGIFIPISLFIFGWTSRADVHWIWPIVGAGLYMPGIYLLFESALVYLPRAYPGYVASVLAGNTFFRSSTAAAFPLFGKVFFTNLGIGPGSSLLAGLAILMIPCLWLLMVYGPRLRARSKYAE